MNNYSIIKYIYFGTSEKIYKAIDLRNNQIVALKKINLVGKKDDLEGIYNECKITMLSKCDFIVKCHEIFYTDEFVCLVFPFYEYGDLQNFISKRKKLSEDEIWKIITQLFIAIDYIHSNNIIHNDINMQNILVRDNGDIVLAGFGNSKIWGEIRYHNDIWSVGKVLYELKIKNNIIDLKTEYSPHLVSLCNKLLQKTIYLTPPIDIILQLKTISDIMIKNCWERCNHIINKLFYNSKQSLQSNLACIL